MKNILMIVYGQIQYDARVIRAAECLSDVGNVVKVISFNSDPYFKNEKFDSVVFQSHFRGSFALFYFWWKCILYIRRNRKKIDLLYVHDYYLSFIGKYWYELFKRPWVYDAHELLFYHKKDNVVFRNKFFLFLEAMSIRSASLVVAANEERRKMMQRIYHLRNSIYVLNIANVNRKEVGLREKENFIVYQGVISDERNVSFFIKAHILVDMRFRLKLIGGGPHLSICQQQVENLGLVGRVIFTGKINQERLYEESQYAKIGIVTYPLNDLNNYYCSPNKIFEYAKMKIPMIVSPQPFLVDIVERYHIGEVFDIYKGENEYIRIVNKIIGNYAYYIEKMDDFLNDFSAACELSRLQLAVSNIKITLN